MKRNTKQFFHFLLMAIIAISSVQSVYASTQDKCKHASSPIEKSIDNNHCQQMQADDNCKCADNCGCKAHLSSQNNITISTVIHHYHLSFIEIIAEIDSQYNQHFYNPLLRPPIS